MPSSDDGRFHMSKLAFSLESVIGKTISDVVVVTNPPRSGHLFLVFSDGTHYEFYDLDGLNGARWTDRGGVDRIKSRAPTDGTCFVVSENASKSG
jgi:hypothetical protein